MTKKEFWDKCKDEEMLDCNCWICNKQNLKEKIWIQIGYDTGYPICKDCFFKGEKDE